MGKLKTAEHLETLKLVLSGDFVTDYSLAIDGGSGIGDWSKMMARNFDRVISFEPVAETADRFTENITDRNVQLRREALMDRDCRVAMKMPFSLDNHRSYQAVPYAGNIKAITIDSLLLHRCGLIKLSLDGAEHLAIIGAKETIKRCRPVFIVESDRLSGRYGVSIGHSVELLVRNYGYRVAFIRGSDQVVVP